MLSQAKRAGGEPISKIANSTALLIIAIFISLAILVIWANGIFLVNEV